MGFGFKKSVKIGGIRFNFGKNGFTSMSVGKRGLTANFSKKGVRTTTSIPKTGISYSKLHKFKEQNSKPSENNTMSQVTLSRPKCPHCNSIQTKYNSKQSSLSELIYKCNNCGYQFIINVDLEPLQKSINPPTLKKKRFGFFTKLLGWIFLAVIAFFAYMVIFHRADHSQKSITKSEPTEITDNTPQNESILHQVFSEDDEKAVHKYIPPAEKKSIANSSNPNDTLSIKTTIRDSE